MLQNVSEDERGCAVSVTLQFTLGDNYPDEAPGIEIIENEDLSGPEMADILNSSMKVVC